jgi:hypothetical protein
VDKEGKTHYSDRAPGSATAEELKVKPAPSGATAEEGQRRLQELEDHNRSMQRSLEREAETRRQAKQGRMGTEEERDAVCQRLRGELAVLGVQAPVFHTEGGQIVYLSDEGRAQRVASLKQQIQELCDER